MDGRKMELRKDGLKKYEVEERRMKANCKGPLTCK